MTTPAHRIACRVLSEQLQEMAEHVRSGKSPLWCLRSVATSVALVRHVLMGTRGTLTNVVELAPWAKPGTGSECAEHVVAIGALRRDP